MGDAAELVEHVAQLVEARDRHGLATNASARHLDRLIATAQHLGQQPGEFFMHRIGAHGAIFDHRRGLVACRNAHRSGTFGPADGAPRCGSVWDMTDIDHGATPVPRGDQRILDEEIAIAELLGEHGPKETAALAAYKQLVEAVEDPGIRYLVDMIMADEERHHRLITEMLNQIQSFVWDAPVEPHVPYLGTIVDPELSAATEQLIELEKEDARELRRLKRQMRGQPSSSMLPLLVSLMEHDTAKHIAILKLIRSHVKRR